MARITKDKAKKIVEALGRFGFFADDATVDDPFKSKLHIIHARNWPHAGLTVRFQNGEDAARKERLLAWLPYMLPPLDAIRNCVDGKAAKALDQLLGQLADDRKKWDSSIDADWKKLQGNWIIDPKDSNLDGLPSLYMCKVRHRRQPHRLQTESADRAVARSGHDQGDVQTQAGKELSYADDCRQARHGSQSRIGDLDARVSSHGLRAHPFAPGSR